VHIISFFQQPTEKADGKQADRVQAYFLNVARGGEGGLGIGKLRKRGEASFQEGKRRNAKAIAAVQKMLRIMGLKSWPRFKKAEGVKSRRYWAYILNIAKCNAARPQR
jgi:hypothetical protein